MPSQRKRLGEKGRYSSELGRYLCLVYFFFFFFICMGPFCCYLDKLWRGKHCLLDEHEEGLALPLIVQLHVSFSGIKFFFFRSFGRERG